MKALWYVLAVVATGVLAYLGGCILVFGLISLYGLLP